MPDRQNRTGKINRTKTVAGRSCLPHPGFPGFDWPKLPRFSTPGCSSPVACVLGDGVGRHVCVNDPTPGVRHALHLDR